MSIRLIKIKRFETRTTIRLGVNPLVTLVIIAIKAIELITIARTAKENKIKTFIFFVTTQLYY